MCRDSASSLVLVTFDTQLQPNTAKNRSQLCRIHLKKILTETVCSPFVRLELMVQVGLSNNSLATASLAIARG